MSEITVRDFVKNRLPELVEFLKEDWVETASSKLSFIKKDYPDLQFTLILECKNKEE